MFRILVIIRITDVNYYQPVFGILMLIAEACYLLKFPHLNLSYAADKFKEISKPAYIEALINIVFSLLLIKKLGICGVAIGTIIAMIYRLIFHVNYTSKIIPTRKQMSFYKKFIIFFITGVFSFILCFIIRGTINNAISWIIYACVYSLINVLLYIGMSKLFFKKEYSFLKKYLNIFNRKKGEI